MRPNAALVNPEVMKRDGKARAGTRKKVATIEEEMVELPEKKGSKLKGVRNVGPADMDREDGELDFDDEEEEIEQESADEEGMHQEELFFREVESFLLREDNPQKEDVESNLELLEMGFGEMRSQRKAKQYLHRYMELKGALKRLRPCAADEGRSQFPTILNVTNQKLPIFSGDFADWQAFEDAFRLEVDDRKESDAQKLQNLRKCLKGKARNMIEKFGLLEPDAYRKAWEHVRGYYKNSYEAFRAHVARMFRHTPVEFEDAENARKVIDAIEASVEKVKGIIGDICKSPGAWEGIAFTAAVHLISLMDAKTREHWHFNRAKPEAIPTLDEVAGFYLQKVKTWEESKENQKTKKDKEGDQKRKGGEENFANRRNGNDGFHRAAKLSKAECFHCQGSHFLAECKDFLAESHERKVDLLKKFHLCISCGKRHLGQCPARCGKCGGKHRIELCPQM